MIPSTTTARCVALALLLVAITGCNKVADTSRAAESITRNVFADTTSSWVDFFTYNPPMEEPLPQTRYCYGMLNDIVCYDSEQPRLTSKLVGYQDGEKLSWVQPGGGSLGASGGDPIALRPAPPPRPIRAPIVDGIIRGAKDATTAVKQASADISADTDSGDIYTGPIAVKDLGGSVSGKRR